MIEFFQLFILRTNESERRKDFFNLEISIFLSIEAIKVVTAKKVFITNVIAYEFTSN